MFVLDRNRLSSKIQNSQKTLFILCGFPYAGKSYVVQQVQMHSDIELMRQEGYEALIAEYRSFI